MQRLSPVVVPMGKNAFIATWLRTVQGIITAITSATTVPNRRSACRRSATRHMAMPTMGTTSSAMGRISIDRPNSRPKTTSRFHDGNVSVQGRQQSTTSASTKTKLNVVSVRMVAVWKIRLGNRATMTAATAPTQGPNSRRPSTPTRATVEVEKIRFNAAALAIQ